MATLVRLNFSAWETQKNLTQTMCDGAPPFFFVDKRVVGTFRDCLRALEDSEINEAITRLNQDLEKGFSPNPDKLDWVDSVIWGVLAREKGRIKNE